MLLMDLLLGKVRHLEAAKVANLAEDLRVSRLGGLDSLALPATALVARARRISAPRGVIELMMIHFNLLFI